MNINQFLQHRQPRWRQLEAILNQIDTQSLASLSPQQTDEFYELYRLVSSDLNLVQTRTGNPAILEYLEGLVGRAYAMLAVPRKTRLLQAWWNIVRHRFPAIMRTERKVLGFAAAIMLAGAAFGGIFTLVDPQVSEVFIAPFPGHLEESPRARVAKLEAMERSGSSQVKTTGDHAAFSTMLFTHNIRVTVFCFALGLTFGVGTAVLLFYNGAILGSLAALYLQDGVFVFFAAWVGPHGSVELPCILFGCTAGFMMSRAQFRRDRGTLRQQLRAMRPAIVDILIGTATLLVLAGLIEGGFSQINEPTIPYLLKIAVAVALFIALLAYLFVLPVRVSGQDPGQD